MQLSHILPANLQNVSNSELRLQLFFNNMVDDQNINKIVKALENTDNIFTIKATVSLLAANMAKKAPKI